MAATSSEGALMPSLAAMDLEAAIATPPWPKFMALKAHEMSDEKLRRGHQRRHSHQWRPFPRSHNSNFATKVILKDKRRKKKRAFGEERDLFGFDNEEYMTTPACSSFPVPVLPSPQQNTNNHQRSNFGGPGGGSGLLFAQLLDQQKRLLACDLAMKFKNGLAATKLSEEAKWIEMSSLDRHVLLEKLRDVLESLRRQVAGRIKDDVDETISIVGISCA